MCASKTSTRPQDLISVAKHATKFSDISSLLVCFACIFAAIPGCAIKYMSSHDASGPDGWPPWTRDALRSPGITNDIESNRS